jgi:hypothetical protein
MYLTHDLIEALCWGEVLEVIRVGNLPRGPLALVGWVVDQGSEPFALIKRVRLVRAATQVLGVVIVARKRIYLPLPLATTRSLVALGVWNSRCDPVTIFLVIPFFGLLGIWMGSISRRQSTR